MWCADPSDGGGVVSGAHRKPPYREGGPVPGPGVAVAQRVYFDANLPAVRKYIDDAVAQAITQAAGTVRKIREWCDTTETGALTVLRSCDCSGDGEPCPLCRSVGERQLALVEEVRSLLPPVPEAAEGVEQVSDGTRVTRGEDREY